MRMQTSIRKEGPVKATRGSITVVCAAEVSDLAHGGAAIVNGDTWAAKGDFYSGSRAHSCRAEAPKHCAAITELRVMHQFQRRCIDQNAGSLRVELIFTDPEALRLVQMWLCARSVESVGMPSWYKGTTLNGFPRRIYYMRRFWRASAPADAHTPLVTAAQEMAAAVNRAAHQDSRHTTPYLADQFEIIFEKLAAPSL